MTDFNWFSFLLCNSELTCGFCSYALIISHAISLPWLLCCCHCLFQRSLSYGVWTAISTILFTHPFNFTPFFLICKSSSGQLIVHPFRCRKEKKYSMGQVEWFSSRRKVVNLVLRFWEADAEWRLWAINLSDAGEWLRALLPMVRSSLCRFIYLSC